MKYGFIFFFLGIVHSFAQVTFNDIEYMSDFSHAEVTWYRTKNGKSGLINKDSVFITQPKFEYISSIRNQNGILEAGIKKGKQFYRGFINDKGEQITAFIYNYVFISGDFLIVEKDKKYGMLDKKGNYILSLDYELIRNYDEFTLIQKNNKLALFIENHGMVTDFIYNDLLDIFPNYILLKNNQGDFLINNKGETVYSVDNNEELKDMKDSLLIVRNKKADKMFLRDLNNNNLFESDYNEIEFISDLLKVSNNKKTGIVTYNNEIIIPLDFSSIYQFKNDYFMVQNNKISGLYKLNNLVLPLKYKHMNRFLTNYLYVTNDNDLSGLYDANLNVVIPEEYRIYEYYKSFYLVEQNNQLLIFNIDDKSITKLNPSYKFRDENHYWITKRNYFVLQEGNKYGVVNYKGEIVVPFEYDYIEPIYASNKFIAKKSNKYGLISSKNEIIKEFKFDHAQLVKEAVFFYQKGKRTDSYAAEFD
ncbi:WG repeat-containing protein [Flavobacterium sp. CBA20B-1]|uniref:WG repeat-containing protein n=1 Tax=unclassified Flavobacterium TaxID=196869 RepID=UPI00222411E8|nr:MULTISPECIES: WG repeat-containing protein [unclassified Flavobacterium]WCM42329.1 WG repeat-containing protein [Flavobacterium sp. CBA20B-1]